MTAFNIDVLVLLGGAFVLGLLMGLWLRRGRPPASPGLPAPGPSQAAASGSPSSAKAVAPESPAPTTSRPPAAEAEPPPAAPPQPPVPDATPPAPPPAASSSGAEEAALASSRTADLFGHLLTGAAVPKRPAPLPSAAASHPGNRPPTLDGPDDGQADDLKLLKGIGPQNEQRLNALGIFHFRQIAAWTPEEVVWVGSYLAFPGRIERENWIAQAQALMSPGAASPSREQDGAV